MTPSRSTDALTGIARVHRGETEPLVDREGWRPLAEAAPLFNVSVSTLRRRIASGQLEARREERPRGFRWLVRVPDAGRVPRPAEACPSDVPHVGVPYVDPAAQIECATLAASALHEDDVAIARHRTEFEAQLAEVIGGHAGTTRDTTDAPHSLRWFILATIAAAAMFLLAGSGAGTPAVGSLAGVLGTVAALVACGEAISMLGRHTSS